MKYLYPDFLPVCAKVSFIRLQKVLFYQHEIFDQGAFDLVLLSNTPSFEHSIDT
jgi:hypothetical protein